MSYFTKSILFSKANTKSEKNIRKTIEIRFTGRIPSENMKLSAEDKSYCKVLCSLPDDLLLISKPQIYGVRALSLRNKHPLLPPDVFELKLKSVATAAYDARTDTLLIEETPEVCEEDPIRLVSMRREENKWIEVQEIFPQYGRYTMNIVVCDSLVLISKYFENTVKLHVFYFDSELSISYAGSIIPKNTHHFCSFSCTQIGTDIFVAFSEELRYISLHRLERLGLEPIERVDVNYHFVRKVLFYRNVLLVAVSNDRLSPHSILAYIASESGLTYNRTLVDSNEGIRIHDWCLANNRLVVSDHKLNQIFIFSLDLK